MQQELAQGTDLVVVVDGRPRFHRAHCRHVLDHDDALSLPGTEAVALGFTPCGQCKPGPDLTDRIPRPAQPVESAPGYAAASSAASSAASATRSARPPLPAPRSLETRPADGGLLRPGAVLETSWLTRALRAR